MLSAETASGHYPVKAVEAMVRICLGAERQFDRDTDFEAAPRNLQRADQAIAMAAMFLAEHTATRAIIATRGRSCIATCAARVSGAASGSAGSGMGREPARTENFSRGPPPSRGA